MATASPPRPARARIEELRSAPPRRAAAAAATVVGVAVLLRLAYSPWFLNYDARYALLWARDAWHGFKPEYAADFAPTPHPLETAVSSLALPFGNASDQVVTWMILLCFGALVWLTFRLGSELFSPWVGGVAALVVLTRPAMERDAVLAYQDVAFAALVVGAVLLEARRPRRGAPVLAPLAAAGLLRPEAWVLGGVYAAYVWRSRGPRERAGLIALALLAPVVWAVSDWIVTGDALHSLHGTADLAAVNDRRRSVDQVPHWTAAYFGYALRQPLVVGVPIGLVFAWRHARRAAVLPIATAVVMTVIFAFSPIFGLPLIRRYIETPAVLLTLFYGLAVCGWMLLPEGRERRRWQWAAVFAAALSLVYIPWHGRLLSGIETRMDRNGQMYGDLRKAAQAPAVKSAFAACAPLTAGDHRPIPYVRYWLGGRPGSVGTVEGGASPLGRMLLLPRHARSTRGVYNAKTFPKVEPPQGWNRIYRNRSWRVYAAPGCGAVKPPPS